MKLSAAGWCYSLKDDCYGIKDFGCKLE